MLDITHEFRLRSVRVPVVAADLKSAKSTRDPDRRPLVGRTHGSDAILPQSILNVCIRVHLCRRDRVRCSPRGGLLPSAMEFVRLIAPAHLHQCALRHVRCLLSIMMVVLFVNAMPLPAPLSPDQPASRVHQHAKITAGAAPRGPRRSTAEPLDGAGTGADTGGKDPEV
jgi:hypothetical protein